MRERHAAATAAASIVILVYIDARMRSVADLTAYLAQVTSLVTVRETVYILGGSSPINVNRPSYASIVAISLLDDELHTVIQ